MDKCQRNLVLQGCCNVQVFHAAVYHTSLCEVPVFAGRHLNDTIYANQETATPSFYVPTLALDDFVSVTGLVPKLIKMDIEGAEFDALSGMSQTISQARPHMILETQPSDTRCLDLLIERGYVSLDLNTYREVRSANDYPAGVAVRNNLYVHRKRLSEVPYRPPFTFVEAAVSTVHDFEASGKGPISLKSEIFLEKGRYVINVDMTAEGRDNEMMCGVRVGDKVILRYHAYTQCLAQSYREWVIHLPKPSGIKLYFEFLNDTRDDTFLVKGAKVLRIKEFDEVPLPLYI